MPTFGAGYLYGPLDETYSFTGKEIAYVYPDFKTAIYGTFEKSEMKDGKSCKISAETCNKFGIKVSKKTRNESWYFLINNL